MLMLLCRLVLVIGVFGWKLSRFLFLICMLLCCFVIWFGLLLSILMNFFIVIGMRFGCVI